MVNLDRVDDLLSDAIDAANGNNDALKRINNAKESFLGKIENTQEKYEKNIKR